MEDIDTWLNKVVKDLKERYVSPEAAKAAMAVALLKEAKAAAAADTSQQEAADTSDQQESDDEEAWERCDLGLDYIKIFNEEEYKTVIESKDMMKQQWKMTEMRGSLLDKYQYEEAMQEVKKNRDRFGGEESKGDDCDCFVAGNGRMAIKEKYESLCWDWFFLGFEWYKKLRFYGAEEFSSAHTLQIYTLKLTRGQGDDDQEGVDHDSDNSLHVYGFVHLFSATGRLYQVIFNRKREDCQTLTKEDPYLRLTGPALPPRAPEDELRIQGTLKLKSTATDQSEDTFLSLSLTVDQDKMAEMGDEGLCPTGKHYLLEMTRCIVIFSLVATISVEVEKDISLQHCRFTAFTASLPDMKVVLLDSRYGQVVSTDDNGIVPLSRRTVAVESGGSLKVVIERGGYETEQLDFSTPKTDDYPQRTVVYDRRNVCVSAWGTIQVKVAWSHWWDKFRKY